MMQGIGVNLDLHPMQEYSAAVQKETSHCFFLFHLEMTEHSRTFYPRCLTLAGVSIYYHLSLSGIGERETGLSMREVLLRWRVGGHHEVYISS
jgi:hypothetical protein